MGIEDIGVVIPALNAERTITPLLDKLIKLGFRPEHIIVVDDGSQDRTAELASARKVTVTRHKKNYGKGAALKSGFEVARSKGLSGVFTVDADGQHLVDDIKRFLKKCKQYDLVLGVRWYQAGMPFIRWLVNRITSLVISVLSRRYIPDVQCGFRFIELNIFDHITLQTNHYQTESELVFKAIRNNYRVGFVPITTIYQAQRSYIKPFIDTLRFIKMSVGLLWQ